MLDYDTTETHRSMHARNMLEAAPSILWVHPEYGRITKPARRCVVGRATTCDIQLEGVKISREHAEIARSGSALCIRDLGSRNGLWVNGRRSESAVLHEGDMIRVGEWVGFMMSELTHDVSFSELAPGLFSGPRLAKLLEPARTLAQCGLPLVIQGATGTGKECVARALHAWSGRSGEYVAVNCAAIPGQLAESELFGHEKGAFTGAERARLGIFRQADRGTLLLDEFLELSARTQAKLLRVLEERTVQPLGDGRAYPVDVLLLAATQLPLSDMVQSGQLRSDLVARLGVYNLCLPSLACRREDIAPMFVHFTRDSSGHGPAVASELVEWLCQQPWEQNVRELEWLARAMITLHKHVSCLSLDHLPPSRHGASTSTTEESKPAATVRRRPPVDDESLYEELLQALHDNGGIVRRAAVALGITRQKAYRLLEKRGVPLDELRKSKAAPSCQPHAAPIPTA